MESFQDFLLTEVADYEAYLKKYANSKSKKKLMTRTDFNTWKKHNEYWKSLPKKNGIVTGPAKKKVTEEVEQIDELEKKTVHSYLNKADPSQGMRNAEKETPGILKNPNALRQYKKKVKAGVSRALDRLKPKESVSEAAQIGVGSKVYHPIHGSGKVLKHSTGAGADHWAEVKFLSGNTKRVNRKHLKLEEVVAEGMDYSVTVKHTKDGKTTDHEYTVKNANDKRHAKNIALQRHEKKIGGLKDSEQISASSNHVKELRKEEVHINEALDPSEIAGNPKMYDAATVKKAFYHKNASESDKQSLARHLDRHYGNKEWRKSVKEEVELCPKCGMSPCQCDGFAEQKETNMSISFKDFVNMLEEAKCKMKEAEEIETSDYKTDKNGRKHRAHKIVFNKGENKQEKDDEDDMKEELKGNQHKLDKNKNGKLDAHDFKLLRKEEVELSEFTSEEISEFMQTEEFAQLDELSKEKLGWYLKKAKNHMAKKGENMIKRDKKFKPGMNPLTRAVGGTSQRMQSIAQAAKKYLAKEEVVAENFGPGYAPQRRNNPSPGGFERGDQWVPPKSPKKKKEQGVAGNQHKLDKNKNGKLDAEDFKKLRKEELEQFEEDYTELLEAFDPDHYQASHEKSKFKDGYRAVLKHKETGREVYVGSTAYKSKEHAEGEAETYKKHYSVGSGKVTPGANYRHDRAVSDYRKKAKEAGHIAEAKFDALKLDEAETIKKDGVTRHKGDYGTSYDGDDNKKPAPTVKRGRGRPKKGSDETGEVKKFDFSALIQKHKIPKFTGKSTVHKMKD